MMKRTLYYDFFNPDAPPQEVDIRHIFGPLEWPVKKSLTTRDVENGQLVIPKYQFVANILPQLHQDEQHWLNHRYYLPITVRDLDTLTQYQLCFWKNAAESYVLTEGWKSSFITRRGLCVGAEVGFFWDQGLEELHFTVLKE